MSVVQLQNHKVWLDSCYFDNSEFLRRDYQVYFTSMSIFIQYVGNIIEFEILLSQIFISCDCLFNYSVRIIKFNL